MGCCLSSQAVFPTVGYEKIKNDTNPLIVECCPGSMRRRNFRGGGQAVVRGMHGISAAVAVTDQRVLVYDWARRQHVHAPFSDDRIRDIEFRVDSNNNGKEEIFCINSRVEPFHPNGSMRGELEYRIVTTQAQEILDRIRTGISNNS